MAIRSNSAWSAENILVRPMTEHDAPIVAQIWRGGLKQTEESYYFLRPLFSIAMQLYGSVAMRPDGDVGPDGANLVSKWMSPKDRIMLVACHPSHQQQSVGCVGVKVGRDLEKVEPSSTVASVWRMSVHEAYRRNGVGMALIKAAEDWARQRHCQSMCLVTSNKIAANFYTYKAGYVEKSIPVDNPYSIQYLFFNHVRLAMQYEKSLVSDDESTNK